MSGMKSTLKAAEEVIGRMKKLADTISKKVQGELAETIERKIEAESALAKIEIDAAVNGGDEKNIAKARERLAASHSQIDMIASSLRGLRGALMALGSDLGKQYTALENELPAHATNIRESFARRWNEAMAEWSKILGERTALETLTGSKMDLPEPMPSEFSLGEERRPYELLTELKRNLQIIVGMNSDAYAKPEVVVDPHRVYVARRAYRGLDAGQKLVECAVGDGRLRTLIALNDVYPLKDSAKSNGVQAAKQTLAEIDTKAREDGLKASKDFFQERYLKNGDGRTVQRDDVPVPETEYFVDGKRVNYNPTLPATLI